MQNSGLQLDKWATETKHLIKGLLSEVSYKRVLLKSAMKVIDDRQNLISEKKKRLTQEITEMVKLLTNAINLRGKQLAYKLNEICDSKQKTLNEKKVTLEQLSRLTDHCIEFVNNGLNTGSDMALLSSKANVMHHLQRIKSRRADIPNPEIPVRIALNFEKITDLARGSYKRVLLKSAMKVIDDRPTIPEDTSYKITLKSPSSSTSSKSVTPPSSSVNKYQEIGERSDLSLYKIRDIAPEENHLLEARRNLA
ncbi:uncharacterized protein LOC103517871 [Diaphorina citri]|uniref:Uncharacterized protein LOC103517871 n=1 Tax=Diaphorina citri TaxID=121845 RepID=A0A3Q0JB09_DIACI|nr:uncharacterized protein LOC103517871 [Diaphorina citri]